MPEINIYNNQMVKLTSAYVMFPSALNQTVFACIEL